LGKGEKAYPMETRKGKTLRSRRLMSLIGKERISSEGERVSIENKKGKTQKAFYQSQEKKKKEEKIVHTTCDCETVKKKRKSDMGGGKKRAAVEGKNLF